MRPVREDCQRINFPFWSLINHNLAAQLIGSNASSPTLFEPVSFRAFLSLCLSLPYHSCHPIETKWNKLRFFIVFGLRHNEYELNFFLLGPWRVPASTFGKVFIFQLLKNLQVTSFAQDLQLLKVDIEF